MFYESRLLVDSDSRSLRFVHFNILKNSFCLVKLSLIFEAKADAKINRFSVYFQIFSQVFSNFFFLTLVIIHFEQLNQVSDPFRFYLSTSQELC